MTWKNNFYLTKKERNGLCLIAVVISLVILFLLVRNDFSGPQKFTFNELNNHTASNQAIKASKSNSENPKTQKFGQKKEHIENQRFEFDPNTISKDSLTKLGVSKFASDNLIKYRSRGKIKSFQQFSNIYGMEEIASELEAYIKIPTNPPVATLFKKDTTSQSIFDKAIKDTSTTISVNNKKSKKEYHFELNTVDSFELQLLEGIGPFYARKIITYRDKLGGFYSVDQLYEIEKIPKETIDKIIPHLETDASKINQLNANAATADDLAIHPYFPKKKAIIFAKYRKNHPHMNSLSDFAGVRIFDAEELKRLSYYLHF